MKDIYENILNSERTVEVEFMLEMISNYCNKETKILDVGGINTNDTFNLPIINLIKQKGCQYSICDFRGGQYKGDFIKINFVKTFDIIIFLSSLEHFPQCTEGDMIYREDEDICGFKKSISLLNKNGKIFLTVPYGKYSWQPYHVSYDWNRIKNMIKQCTIELQNGYIYKLIGNEWHKTNIDEKMENCKKINGVGCFIFERSY